MEKIILGGAAFALALLCSSGAQAQDTGQRDAGIAGCAPVGTPYGQIDMARRRGVAIRVCDNTPGPEARWLVGEWVAPGKNCNGDALIYAADGRWADPIRGGRWTLSGNVITRTVEFRDKGRGYEPVREAPHRWEVVTRTSSGFTQRAPDGRTVQVLRCPTTR